ncbi:hypothetical protein STVA_34820 [Allostella vacuolata]|nr:hypothetical protein STVA_34820 [Stella vacuolata]
MSRLAIFLGLALLAAACSGVPGPSVAMRTAAPDPECLQATPGNSLDGFRCTGDYSGDGGNVGRGR